MRIAVHPDAQQMGYGSRALQQLQAYYRGDAAPLQPPRKAAAPAPAAPAAAAGEGAGLLHEALAPRSSLPPLLLSLAQRPAEALDWLGASFGLTEPLFRFWHRNGFLPAYLRQTKNELTGEHSAILLHDLAAARAAGSGGASAPAAPSPGADSWLSLYCADFRRRLSALLGMALRDMPCSLALSLLAPQLQPDAADEAGAAAALSAAQLDFVMGAYDMKRLRSYASNLVDHRLVADLVPLLARLRFSGRLRTPLSHVQAAILLGAGLQSKSFEELEKELGLPVSQLLALFNKAVRKMSASLQAVLEAREEATLPAPSAMADATAHMAPLAAHLDAELDSGAQASLAKLAAAQQEQQAQWLEGEGLSKYAIRGTDDDWAAALPQGRPAVPPKHLSVKGEARPTDKPAKKGGKSEGGSKASKGSKGGSGKGGGDRKPKRQKQ